MLTLCEEIVIFYHFGMSDDVSLNKEQSRITYFQLMMSELWQFFTP